MALTTQGPNLEEIVGVYSKTLVWGIGGGSGTTTTVTIPQFSICYGALVGGGTSTTAVYCDTASDNTFTATHASSDIFTYVAFGKLKA